MKCFTHHAEHWALSFYQKFQKYKIQNLHSVKKFHFNFIFESFRNFLNIQNDSNFTYVFIFNNLNLLLVHEKHFGITVLMRCMSAFFNVIII